MRARARARARRHRATAPLSCAGVDNPWTTAQEGSYQTLSTEEAAAAEEEAEAEEAEAK